MGGMANDFNDPLFLHHDKNKNTEYLGIWSHNQVFLRNSRKH